MPNRSIQTRIKHHPSTLEIKHPATWSTTNGGKLTFTFITCFSIAHGLPQFNQLYKESTQNN